MHSVVVAFLIIAGLAYLLRRHIPWLPAQRGPYPPLPSIRAFRNPMNGYEEEVGTPWIWCLLFGCFYFAARGVWTHAVVAALLAFVTFGISWLIYPAFARQIIQTHYLRRGWVPI